MTRTGSAQVAQVITPQVLQLHDGRFVHLVGLDIPYLHAREDSPLAPLTIKILKDMLEGERVHIYQSRNQAGHINRMEHYQAHIERASDKQWVQGMLLSLGLARVRTTLNNRDMAKQMYQIEKQARVEGIGIWEDESYALLTPKSAMNQRDHFAIIEGVVQSTALKRNTIYINFGKDWRTDFTIAISAKARRLFTKAQIDPLQWNQKKIRVRGWLEQFNGPYMKIDHPERVEIFKSALPPLVKDAP